METNEKLKIFIKTNSEYLHKKLDEYGLRQNTLDDLRCPWLAVNYGMYISVTPDFDNSWNKDHICCESDEVELFLALCALRKSTDIDQYFIIDTNLADLSGEIKYPKGSLMKCTIPDYTRGKNLEFDSTTIPAHKASISELLDNREELKRISSVQP